MGVTIRAGAPKPDIATADAFKRALQDAKTISYSDGPSGVYIASLLQRLGLAEEMKAKTRLAKGRPVADLVAKGEAEIGMQQITEILPVKGAELLGPLPDELQNIIVYAAGIGAAAKRGRCGPRVRHVSGDAGGCARDQGHGHGAGLTHRPEALGGRLSHPPAPQMCLRHRTFVPISA